MTYLRASSAMLRRSILVGGSRAGKTEPKSQASWDFYGSSSRSGRWKRIEKDRREGR